MAVISLGVHGDCSHTTQLPLSNGVLQALGIDNMFRVNADGTVPLPDWCRWPDARITNVFASEAICDLAANAELDNVITLLAAQLHERVGAACIR